MATVQSAQGTVAPLALWQAASGLEKNLAGRIGACLEAFLQTAAG